MGEAAKRLSPTALKQYPSVPWSKIMRTRDKLISHYEGWDLEEIWQLVLGDVPNLYAALTPDD